MPRQSRREATPDASPVGEKPSTGEASEEEREGKRGHDDQGNVRPADGRWNLHEPKDESKYVRTEIGTESD